MANKFNRRFHTISNTSVEGEMCIYHGHALGRFSSSSMRYDSHLACVRCVAAAREGRLSLDVDRLLKKERSRALKFWSQVDIGDPDDCWNWKGCINKRTKMPQFSWRRSGISTSTQHHPQRVAMWLSWGDLGVTQVKPICGNRMCCNPFHLIPQKIGVFVDSESYLESFELACQLHTLKQRVQEYTIEEMLKEQQEQDHSFEIDARAELLMNPNTTYDERMMEAMKDLLEGRHISQTEPTDSGLFRAPSDQEIFERNNDKDKEEDEENPPNEF